MDLPPCVDPPCIVTIEAPAPSELGLVEELLAPLDEAVDSVVAATGIGLEELLTEEELAALPRLKVPLPALDTEMSALVAGDPAGRRVVMLHGSPGVAAEWGSFLREPPAGLEIVAVDRLGFGESGPEGAVPSLLEQAAALLPLLEETPAGQRPLLVGYSYGGPVALMAAALFPDRVGGVLLVGAAVDPELEEENPLQSLALDVELLLPRDLANSNSELLALREELRGLALLLPRVAAPVVAVHGTADTLVPIANLDYLAGELPEQARLVVVRLEGADHFLPWSDHPLLVGLLEDLAQRAQGAGF